MTPDSTRPAPPSPASPPSPPPGLCATCRHTHKNETRRGTTYYRCTRAAWDDRLPKYPRLPVLSCPGYEPAD